MSLKQKKKQSGMQENVFIQSVKKTAGKVVDFVRELWAKIRTNVRGWHVFVAAIGIVLSVTVIVLAIGLNGVTKELEAIQTMSRSLKEELETTRLELDALQLAEKEPENDSERDLEKEASVLLSATPVPTSAPAPTSFVKKYVVCVDAGHGDWDGGAVFKDENGREVRIEKDDNLRMAKWFREALEAYGIEVVLTRETDVYLGLKERAAIANNVNADALISFHRNSYVGEEDVSGVEFWIHSSQPQDAKTLAQGMLDAVMEVGGMTSRGVKSGSIGDSKVNYVINSTAGMSSLIVELGFISSASDNEAYDTYGKAYAEKMAEAVFVWLETQTSENESQ